MTRPIHDELVVVTAPDSAHEEQDGHGAPRRPARVTEVHQAAQPHVPMTAVRLKNEFAQHTTL